jgi:uncharacterized membrane protein YhhN
MKTRFRTFTIGYFSLAIFYLVCLIFAPEEVQFLLKCTFMPILLAAIVFTEGQPNHLLKGSLLLAWLGDMVISFAAKSDLYFIGGLAAFLLAQAVYILLFKRSIRTHPQNRGYHIWAFSLLAAAVFGLLALLLPRAGNLAVPILVYAITIATMMVFAIKGWAHWPIQAADWLVAGAASFVVSDALLAINKFCLPLPFAGIGIMATYLFAQWAIVRAILEITAIEEAKGAY